MGLRNQWNSFGHLEDLEFGMWWYVLLDGDWICVFSLVSGVLSLGQLASLPARFQWAIGGGGGGVKIYESQLLKKENLLCTFCMMESASNL